ncbi:MAG: hypothetical protein FWD16_02240 [Clostridia bacterium]|nr:hypothetical protein [Clostridia bacterium]
MMNSKQRVMTALRREKPDRTPFMELAVDVEIGQAVTGKESYTPHDLANALALDGISGGSVYPNLYAQFQTADDGRSYIVGGLLKERSYLSMIKMTDPENDSRYDIIKRNVDACGRECAVFATTNIGLDPLLLGMGMEHFSYALMDDPAMIEEILDIYTEWAVRVAQKIQACGVDFIWFTDDVAFNTGLMFSPEFFREIAMPRLARVTQGLDIPIVFHSDGLITPILNDLHTLGVDAIHPLDPCAVDIAEIKRGYGDKFCLIGNIDLRHTLVKGTPAEVRTEVAERIATVGYNGGYIVSSANSITKYCKLENVLAMRDAILEGE